MENLAWGNVEDNENLQEANSIYFHTNWVTGNGHERPVDATLS